jgi:hypothetical protein
MLHPLFGLISVPGPQGGARLQQWPESLSELYDQATAACRRSWCQLSRIERCRGSQATKKQKKKLGGENGKERRERGTREGEKTMKINE